MSETYTQSKQLHLFNIITFAEDKLQSNFNRILYRLNNHQKVIQKNGKQIIKLSQLIQKISNDLQGKLKEQKESNEDSIGKVKQEAGMLNESMGKLNGKLMEMEENMGKMMKGQEYLRQFIDSDCKGRNIESENARQKIRNIEYELNNIVGNLTKKQNVSQVFKLKQSLTEFNQQMSKLENEQKFVQFKLDKFEINNQKMEKNQMNKEMMLIKDLEEKIKKQLKFNINTSQQNGPLNTMNIPSPKQNSQNSVQQKKMVVQQVQNGKQNLLFNKCSSISSLSPSEKQKNLSENIQIERLPSFESQVVTNIQNLENQMIQKLIEQLNKTVNFHQRRFDVIQREIKDVAHWWEQSQKSKKNSPTQFEQKLNAIRPQFIKIWAKLDALEEKTGVHDRKLEQKNIQIANIMEIMKQTQAARFDEKLKVVQSQTLINLKQIKSKLDGKVNCVDFEKFSKITNDKFQGHSDQLILKCDKAEVKKALLFLQSKIKEIILVISEEEQNQKDALLTKKQLKCISCDKDVDKFLGTANGMKGNWDSFPFKDHSNDSLGRFGMTSYGTLARKLKRLEKDMPNISHKRNKQSTHSQQS